MSDRYERLRALADAGENGQSCITSEDREALRALLEERDALAAHLDAEAKLQREIQPEIFDELKKAMVRRLILDAIARVEVDGKPVSIKIPEAQMRVVEAAKRARTEKDINVLALHVAELWQAVDALAALEKLGKEPG